MMYFAKLKRRMLGKIKKSSTTSESPINCQGLHCLKIQDTETLTAQQFADACGIYILQKSDSEDDEEPFPSDPESMHLDSLDTYSSRTSNQSSNATLLGTNQWSLASSNNGISPRKKNSLKLDISFFTPPSGNATPTSISTSATNSTFVFSPLPSPKLNSLSIARSRSPSEPYLQNNRGSKLRRATTVTVAKGRFTVTKSTTPTSQCGQPGSSRFEYVTEFDKGDGSGDASLASDLDLPVIAK